jgi:hypothetical protein
MRLTRSSVIVAIIGVLLIVAAGVVRWVVLPSVSKLPDDLDTSQQFEGTYTGLNPAALSGAAAGDVMLGEVPVTATRTYAVESTDGDTALVTRTVERSIAGQPDPTSVSTYAIDRVDFDSTTPPSGAEDVVASEGLVFTLPLDPSTDADYELWDVTTAAAYPLTYEGTSTVEDRTVYEYRTVAEGPVADPQAAGLPTSLSRDQLQQLAGALTDLLPPELLAQLPGLLPQLPSEIPLEYTSVVEATVFADSDVGAPLRTESVQQITASLALGPQLVEVPFSTISLASTADSEQAMADDAATNARLLNLVGTVLPIVLLVVGVLLLILALLLARRGRGGGPEQTPAQPPRAGTPVHA